MLQRTTAATIAVIAIITVVIIVIAAAQVMTAELLSGLQCQQE